MKRLFGMTIGLLVVGLMSSQCSPSGSLETGDGWTTLFGRFRPRGLEHDR